MWAKYLYSNLPEFDELNHHGLDDMDYIVFADLSLLLRDLIELHKTGDIQFQEFSTPVELKTKFKVTSEKMLGDIFNITNTLLDKHDASLNDMIFTSIFETLDYSEFGDEYARKFLSSGNYVTYLKTTGRI